MSAAEVTVLERVRGDALAAAPERYDGLLMGCSPAEARMRLDELAAFVRSAMVEGVDFGKVPGSAKPSLWQPGAQKLAELYGLAHRFVVSEAVKDWERGFFYFEMKCQLVTARDGRFVGEGIGSCNSKESRYGNRWVFESEVPAGIDFGSLRSQVKTSRKNGKDYVVYLVTNEDPFSLVNTMQKMACKRSLVHAVLSVTRSSGIFTQDVEDLPASAFGSVDEERPWQRDRDRDLKPENAVEIVDRDTKPANAPPSPAAPTAERTAPGGPAPAATAPPANEFAGMTDPEAAAARDHRPRFEAATSLADLGACGSSFATACGGARPSAAARLWYSTIYRASETRIVKAARPGPAKTDGGSPSSPTSARASDGGGR